MPIKTMMPAAALDKFHSLLMEDDDFSEAMHRVALQVAQYYAGPGAKLDDQDYQFAMELVCRVGVS